MASRDILADTMRSTGLVVMTGAGLLVVGYAFYTLLDVTPRREPSGRSRAEARAHADADANADARSRRPLVRRAAAPADEPSPVVIPPVADARPQPGPPPRPEPEIPLDEARTRLADFMAELEGIERGGVALTSPEWVDYYRRGHEAILPLQQHLLWSIPEQADELRRANEDLRTKLHALDPAAPAEPPP